MSTVHESITSGVFLPHVYLKKTVLEPHPDSSITTNVTLHLELLQAKKSLSTSSWLNDLSVEGNSLLDYVYIQILYFTDPGNISKLKASTAPLTRAGNFYLAKQDLDSFKLPRGSLVGSQTANIKGNPLPPEVFNTEVTQEWSLGNPPRIKHILPGVDDPNEQPACRLTPIKIRTSSLAGDLTSAWQNSDESKTVIQGLTEGKIREEIRYGEAYLVIPFTKTYSFDNLHNLGFAFYTFLNTPEFVSKILDSDDAVSDNNYNDYVIDGPVNTEVILQSGALSLEREIFADEAGREWDGPVHLHRLDLPELDANLSPNPDPTGYAGDGSFGQNKGWMAGEKHAHDAPKLQLSKVANYKIEDLRNVNMYPEPLDGALGTGMGKLNSVQYLNEVIAGKASVLLSPFQKEARKYIDKFSEASGYDNESEYSKLYITRDRNNFARGMFFIDIHRLLTNNSPLYRKISIENAPWAISEIINNAELLHVKINRDRISKHTIGGVYEKYKNDEFYEEPTYNVGTFSEFSQAKQQDNLYEISVDTGNNSGYQRYYVFRDEDISTKSTGHYQYNIEVVCRDPTYEYLSKFLQKLINAQNFLNSYYELAISGDVRLGGSEQDEIINKKNIVPFYNGHSYDALFTYYLVEKFGDDVYQKLQDISELLLASFYILGYNNDQTSGDLNALLTLLNPDSPSASPRGIETWHRMYGTVIKKLDSMLNGSKLTKNRTDLSKNSSTTSTEYNISSLFNFVTTSNSIVIEEAHTFDSPEEIFQATGNKDIYVDYLSIVPSDNALALGLRALNPEFYKQRCRLDTLKFTPMAISEAGWSGNMQSTNEDYTPFNIAKMSGPGARGQNTFNGTEYLNSAGYSYLTPSIVEISDPSPSNKSYAYYYACYSSNATEVFNKQLASNTEFYSNFYTLDNANLVYANLINYNLNKKNIEIADLMDPLPSTAYSSAGLSTPNGVEYSSLYERESYKKIFNRENITLHVPELHDEFFDKSPGAQPSSSYNPYPVAYASNLYSDSAMLSQAFFFRMLYNYTFQTAGLKMPVGVAINDTWPLETPQSPDSYPYPNSLKIWHVNMNRMRHGWNSILQPVFKEVVTSNAESALGNGLLFLNCNMTVRVETYQNPPSAGVMKFDENSWAPLRESHIDNLSEERALFCRLKIHDQKLLGDIKIPMIDKYFLIYRPNEAGDLGLPYETVSAPDFGASEFETLDTWFARNNELVNEWKTTTEKGMSSDPPPGSSGLPSALNILPGFGVTDPADQGQGPGEDTTPGGGDFGAPTGPEPHAPKGIDVTQGLPGMPAAPKNPTGVIPPGPPGSGIPGAPAPPGTGPWAASQQEAGPEDASFSAAAFSSDQGDGQSGQEQASAEIPGGAGPGYS